MLNETFDIFKQINKEIDEYRNTNIKIADSYFFNQRKIINENIRAYNSQFEGGEVDSEGFRKFYNNIVKSPCNTSTKALKFEPKHIIIRK